MNLRSQNFSSKMTLVYISIFWSFLLHALSNKEKSTILFGVIFNINFPGEKINAELCRYCTAQNVTYKNEIVIHAKSFFAKF